MSGGFPDWNVYIFVAKRLAGQGVVLCQGFRHLEKDVYQLQSDDIRELSRELFQVLHERRNRHHICGRLLLRQCEAGLCS